MYSKRELRSQVKQRRNDMPETLYNDNNMAIREKLYNLREYIEAEAIYTYVSIGREIDTINIINRCFADNKKVAVPKVLSKEEMRFYYITSMSQLEKGCMGILEPVNGMEEARQDRALMIMPGLAFDKSHNRVGYGGGYYDRYLRENRVFSKKIALAYEYQIYDEIEGDVHDIKPDMIITEERII